MPRRCGWGGDDCHRRAVCRGCGRDTCIRCGSLPRGAERRVKGARPPTARPTSSVTTPLQVQPCYTTHRFTGNRRCNTTPARTRVIRWTSWTTSSGLVQCTPRARPMRAGVARSTCRRSAVRSPSFWVATTSCGSCMQTWSTSCCTNDAGPPMAGAAGRVVCAVLDAVLLQGARL